MNTAHSRPTIVVAIGEEALRAEAVHAAAATSHEVITATDPRDIPRSLPGAYTVLVDALMARVIASAQAAQTAPAPVLFLAADPGPIDYEAALACHADRAFIIPAEIKELLAAIAQAAHPPEDRPGSATIAVVGASGGVGTSTFAAALSRSHCTASEQARALLIDATAHSGGLDLLLGVETAPTAVGGAERAGGRRHYPPPGQCPIAYRARANPQHRDRRTPGPTSRGFGQNRHCGARGGRGMSAAMDSSTETMEKTMEKMQRLIAAEPGLVHDASSLARRIREEAGVISDVAVVDLLRRLRQDATGMGPLDALLARQGVTDVVVNGPEDVFMDRGEGLERSDITFRNDGEVRQLASRLAAASGTRLDDAQPFADGRVTRPDGVVLRVHALLSPPAVGGTCISLRVLRQAQTTLPQLVANGTVPEDIRQLLAAMVDKRVSFLVIGGTGSGKTTLLSALLGTVSERERIVVIEDTAELSPHHPHCVSIVSRRANAEGSGEITMAQLLRQALRMRPDRIVVGEIRGPEVVDLLAALNTGHDGGAGTLHANSLFEVPARMEALGALGGLDRSALHSQLAAAVNVVLTMERTPHGRRLAHIGVLEGNPVTPRIVWSATEGPAPGFAEFSAALLDEPHEEAGGQTDA